MFDDTDVNTDGLGETTGSGNVDTGMLKQAMALSGNTLPQVKSSLSGTWHVVTSGRLHSQPHHHQLYMSLI